MNSLVVMSLLVAVASAAPGGIYRNGVVAAPGAIAYSAGPQIVHNHAIAAAPVVQTYAAPAVAHVQVPITKTVHYETKPVVTGYSTSIIKPAIPHLHAAPAFASVSSVQVAAPAPAIVAEQKPVAVAPAPVAVAPAPVGGAEIIEARSAVPVAAPAAIAYSAGPVAVPAPAPVAVARAPQAGDFGPLVTKEQVLAPVRTHTQITPQITQVQPEVTVRRVVTNVDVPQPIYQTPVVHVQNPPVVAAPAVHAHAVAAPAAVHAYSAHPVAHAQPIAHAHPIAHQQVIRQW